MAIDWGSLENDITSYLEKGKNDKNRTISETCAKIESLYISAVVSKGMEQYGNKVSNLSSGPLKASLQSGMEASFRLQSGDPSPLNSSGCSGLLSMWGSAAMEMIVPPAPTGPVVSNVITNPGIAPPMNISLNNLLQKEIIKALKQHAKTVSGICTSLVPVGTALVPTPFPWTGIQ